MAALGDAGRFAVPWMAAARAAKQAASAAAAAAAAAGAGFENIPTLVVATHVMSTEPVADVNAVAKQFNYATAALNGISLAGTAPGVCKNAAGRRLSRHSRWQLVVSMAPRPPPRVWERRARPAPSGRHSVSLIIESKRRESR